MSRMFIDRTSQRFPCAGRRCSFGTNASVIGHILFVFSCHFASNGRPDDGQLLKRSKATRKGQHVDRSELGVTC